MISYFPQKFISILSILMLLTVTPVRADAPTAPSDLRVGGFPGGIIQISWTDNANDETMFELERSVNDRSGFELLTCLDADTTNYADTTVDLDTTYWYRVRACNGELCSSYSKDSFNVSFSAGSVPNLDERYALFLVNEARADPGAFGYPSYAFSPPVAFNELLSYAAHTHSQAILNSDFSIGHCYPEEPTSQTETERRCPTERARDVGYVGGVGENLIAGDDGWRATEGAHQAFMDSKGHRNNLLLPDFTQAGLGHSYDPNKGSVFHGQYTQTFCGWHQIDIPALPSGIVVPYWGRTTTDFTFLVNFYNISGTPPTEATVFIDGVAKPMTLRNGTSANGSYTYSTNLKKGKHSYYYEFRYNDDQIARLPESGGFSGPDVEVGAAVLEVPGEYATLADALAHARGDVIVKLSEGIFYETTPLNIPTSGIWLQGAGMDKTIIHGDGSGHVLGAQVDTVIRDLTITGGGPTDHFESGIWNTAGHVDVRNCRITGNNVGIFSWCFEPDCDAMVTVTNSIIDHNTRAGIDSNEYPIHNLINNTIVANGIGVFLGNSASRVENCIIVKNTVAGLYTNIKSPTVQYNDVWGNEIDYADLSQGVGDIRKAPLFQDESSANFRLRSDSPCIDAGNPSPVFNDPDGSRNDQGAYGGPFAAGYQVYIPLIFFDVPTGYWARDEIEQLYAAGVTDGCTLTEPLGFCPEVELTRAEMAKFLLKAVHGGNFVPTVDVSGGTSFEDVNESHWAAVWIEQLFQDGLTDGCSAAPLKYCPDALVTRAEMAKFLLVAMHADDPNYKPESIETSSFEDVTPGSDGYWAIDWIEAIYKVGVTKGCGEDPLIYCPDKKVTRAEMAVFLVRAFDLE